MTRLLGIFVQDFALETATQLLTLVYSLGRSEVSLNQQNDRTWLSFACSDRSGVRHQSWDMARITLNEGVTILSSSKIDLI
jgi:hypothetical protein